jgi:hypothetical protein
MNKTKEAGKNMPMSLTRRIASAILPNATGFHRSAFIIHHS